jgi:hypothetical protein
VITCQLCGLPVLGLAQLREHIEFEHPDYLADDFDADELGLDTEENDA